MATFQLEEAALWAGRTPEAIEKWIAEGKVEAERAGGDWLVDPLSLLNVTITEDAVANQNGHAPTAAKPPAHVAESPAASAPPADAVEPAPTAAAASGESADPGRTALQKPTVAASHSDRAIADVATMAIQALNARLEQAIGEVERLQDERLKLALQLGYAQSQLRNAQEQLRALAPPAEPNAVARIWRRLTGSAAREAA